MSKNAQKKLIEILNRINTPASAVSAERLVIHAEAERLIQDLDNQLDLDGYWLSKWVDSHLDQEGAGDDT